MAYPVKPCETIVRPIENYENYTINVHGIVTNVNTGLVLKQRISSHGYYYVTLYKNGKGKKFLVHNLLARTFLENPENKEFVDHIDRNKLNNNLINLRYVTMSENNTNRKVQKNNKLKIKGVCLNGNYYECRAKINGNRYQKYIPIKNENSLNLAKFQIVLYDILRHEFAAKV